MEIEIEQAIMEFTLCYVYQFNEMVYLHLTEEKSK